MDNDILRQIKEYWNGVSDSEWYGSLRTDERIEKLLAAPVTAFHPGVLALIEKHIGSVEGKRVLLPSSGDNHAAFALALMGASVTSADISERQLENAKEISDRLGLDIEYVCDDTMTLTRIADGAYNMVYTSNGTLSWIGALGGMLGNIARVLKPGGVYVMYDVHPFNRPFSGEPWQPPHIVKSYHDVFPDLHWRVSDIINASVEAGLSVRELAELSAVDASFWFTYDELIRQEPQRLTDINDPKHNPMAVLPAWLAAVMRKVS